MNVLFLSYTGLLEPLGQSQVLPYVLGLSRLGHEMSVVSFERAPSEEEVVRLAQQLAALGIAWSPLRYHKWPPVLSTAYDILRAGLAVRRAAGASRLQMVHARSHVPALAAELLRAFGGAPYLFDHRGLMAEEFADAGIWRRGGFLHTITNRLEARFVAQAVAVVVLTRRLQAELPAACRSVVIPCAVDLSRFGPAPGGREAEFDLVYAGSWSGLYEANTVLEFFKAYRTLQPEARLLLLVARGTAALPSMDGLEVRHPHSREVPDLLRRARAGVSFRRTGRAAIAASPVKVSEYLATGLPVVTNLGVGDLDELLVSQRTGVVVEDGGTAALARAAGDLQHLLADPETPTRCRRLASERFELEAAVAAYDRLYREIERSSRPEAVSAPRSPAS